MVLGPPWRDADKAEPLQDERAVHAVAGAAAEELVSRLQRAEELTGGWANRELTEALVDAALSECMARLAETGCWGPDNRMASNEFWRIAGPVLEVGVLQSCARFKPHGYAGDYEMLERLSGGFCSEHPLGRAFDRYFQNQAAPQAVRSRVHQAAAALADHCLAHDGRPYRVTSVGSGPAADVRRGLAMLPPGRRSDVRVTLLDIDPNAVEYAVERLGGLIPQESVRGLPTNLYRLPKRSNAGDLLGQPDFLICSGLLDYLDDESAVAMIGLFWRELTEGGLLAVGNFAPHNPTRAYMEWIGNWYLTYRTPDEMRRLGLEAGIPAESLAIRAERLGVDLFLIGRKTSR